MHRRKDGSVYPVEVSAFYLPGSGERIGFIRDITERRRAEDRLKKAIQEKEFLLQELKHRVKNNLHVIDGLLKLELPRLRDPAAADVFRDAQTRIHAIASIYDRLQLTTDQDRVGLRPYLEGLAQALSLTYALDRRRIVLHTKMADVWLDLKRALVLGLVLNELLSNAMKYAYPGEMTGAIRIELEEREMDLLLRIADDGVGFPAGLDIQTSASLGLRLVASLVEQVEGRLEVAGPPGAMITVGLTR